MRSSLTFRLPMLPPSVNHQTEHPWKGVHKKSPAAKAWEQQFKAMLPAEARGQYVIGERFAAILKFFPGPGDRGDVDNRNKLLLDCCAKAGMLRGIDGRQLSDAWFKRLVVDICDTPADRQRGPATEVTIEVIE